MRKRSAVLFSLLLFFWLSAPAWQARRESEGGPLQAAQKDVQEGNHARAEQTLASLLEGEPENGQAWYWLGLARHGRGDWKGALQAYLKAVQLQARTGMAMYHAARAYARLGDLDNAFLWLERACRTGAVELPSLASEPDLEALRRDPRMRRFQPQPEDFSRPFLEPVKVLQEWRGEGPGDQFGWIARRVGDVDGDGIHDVVTSAPTAAGGDGKVYLYSSRSGRLLWSRRGPQGSRLGMGVEAAGDVNGDGVPDVIAGAPVTSQAFVFSGRDGHTLWEWSGQAEKGDFFGERVSTAGDWNGDGRADLLVGAPSRSPQREDPGKVYLFSGRDGTLLLTLQGERPGDRFGSALAGWTGGEEGLLVVGAGRGGAQGRGVVYVYRGRPQAERHFLIEAEASGVALGGMFVSVVGDLDADGMPDVYASDWSDQSLGPGTGRIYVHSGKDGRRLLTLTGEAPGDGFGIGPADAGDVDGDGHDDLVVGAWQHSSAAVSGGKVYLFSGRDGKLLAGITCRVPGDTFGFDATGLGDVDGDGGIDFLLTSAWSLVNGSRSGRVLILSGRWEGFSP